MVAKKAHTQKMRGYPKRIFSLEGPTRGCRPMRLLSFYHALYEVTNSTEATSNYIKNL